MLILMMSQIRKCDLAVSDVASVFLNTPVDESKGLIAVQAPHRLSILNHSQGFAEIMSLSDSCGSGASNDGSFSMKLDPCSLIGRDSSGKVRIVAMAHVDDLIISGERVSSELLPRDSKGVQCQAH